VTSATVVRRRLVVRGVVQGVGFRPHVYARATARGLVGFVGNDATGVFIEVEGPEADVLAFEHEVVASAPPLALVEDVAVVGLEPAGADRFTIVGSEDGPGPAATLVPPDVALCADCLRELFDPGDRRYRYPFITCTNCGPRFTIIRALPYDRPATTMAGFGLCPACAREYDDPSDRRFHAQPVACPACGPRVRFVWSPRAPTADPADPVTTAAADPTTAPADPTTGPAADPTTGPAADPTTGPAADPTTGPAADPIVAAQRVLLDGGVVAVKGVGGFHLACDAGNPDAVARLRLGKARTRKPFAVMARDLATVERFAEVDEEEAAWLSSPAAPVVLLRARRGDPVPTLVAPGNRRVGAMLAYTPLHHLLLRPAPGGPATVPAVLVMTSGNRADEPIATVDGEALERLSDLADAFLLHDRPIHAPCDDSVVHAVAGHQVAVRRSRGFAPLPVRLPVEVVPTLAVGGELKATFCLAVGRHAWMSQHLGDMGNLETLRAFEQSVAHLCELYRVTPERLAADRHPAYLTGRWARARSAASGATVVEVQHHHAHLASVMAEHGVGAGDAVLGFAFDGTGFGDDGAIWGGEVLVATYEGYRRAAHLAPVPLPGGDAAIRHPWRAALAHLWAAGVTWDERLPPVGAAGAAARRVLVRQLETGVNCVPTTSMGRLFDAVASLVGLCHEATYEAQGAIELEALVAGRAQVGYRFEIDADPCGPRSGPGAAQPCGPRSGPGAAVVVDAAPVIRAVAADVLGGVPAATVAARFHRGVAGLVVTLAERIRGATGLDTVALSGGVFQNAVLVEEVHERLDRSGMRVLTHRLVPSNDGGLALGQSMIAGLARLEPGGARCVSASPDR